MINEIVIGKKYKAKNANHTRTPLLVHNTYVFYEHDYRGYAACANCCVEDFQRDVEEVPEAPEKWFKVIYKRKNADRPSYCMTMFKSEEDFFATNPSLKEDLDFFHMEEIKNQLEKKV